MQFLKQLLVLGLLAFIATVAWVSGTNLRSDALAMAVGILLGMLAAMPVSLLFLASGQRRDGPEPRRDFRPSPDEASQREQLALRRENIRLQTALDARRLPQPTKARLRVVDEWEQ